MIRTQFRLRTTVVLVAVLAATFAYVSRGVVADRRQAEAVANLRNRRVAVIYDWTTGKEGSTTPVQNPAGQNTFRRVLGDDFFDEVVGLWNHNDGLSDEDIRPVAYLTDLRYLSLARSEVTDAGLAVLAGLERVAWLDLSDTPVTDLGVSKLTAMPALRFVDLSRTRITAESLRTLARIRSLEAVGLSGNHLSPTELDELRHTKPELHLDLEPLIPPSLGP